MYIEQDGHWLRCEPPTSVPPMTEIPLDVHVGPTDEAVRLEALFRVGDHGGRVVAVSPGGDGHTERVLRAVLPDFAAGDVVEVTLVAWFGGRRMPEAADDASATFRIAVEEASAPAAVATLGGVDRARLAGAGFPGPAEIAELPRAAFVRAVDGVLDPAEAGVVHDAAATQLAVLGSAATAHRINALYSVNRPPPGDCGCPDCGAATSPVAYLTDLLAYTQAWLRWQDGVFDVEMSREAIAEVLRQPIGELTTDCEATDRDVSALRLAIESVEGLLRTTLAAGPDAAVSPLPHRIAYAFAADVDGDRRQELVVGFDYDASSWLSGANQPRSGFWVLRYDATAQRWRHLRPGPGPMGAAVLLPPGTRAAYGFAARFSPDPVIRPGDRQHIVLALDDPADAPSRYWILEYRADAGPTDEAWQHILPAMVTGFGADLILPAHASGRAFGADVDGDGLDEFVAYGVAPPVTPGAGDRASAFWVYDLGTPGWRPLAPAGSVNDVAFVGADPPVAYQVKLATAGDVNLDGRDEIVAIPDAPGNLGKNPWIMHWDDTAGWTHVSPTGLPLDVDADVWPSPWPAAQLLVGSVTGIGSAELLAAPQPYVGADSTTFWMLRYQPPTGPQAATFVDAGSVDCTALSLPVDRAFLADVDGDGRDELVVGTHTGGPTGRYAAWVMDRDANGTWRHLSPVGTNHPLDADVEWTAAGAYPAIAAFAADVDGDGQQELVFAGGGTQLWVLKYDAAAHAFRHLSPITTAPPRAAFALAAYQALLRQVGTSYEELRRTRGAPDQQRRALADRLGLELGPARPDALDALLLDPADVTQDRLEDLFGLVSTTRDPLADGPVRGVDGDEIVRWRLDGARWSADPASAGTDPDGLVHVSLSRLGPGQVDATLYRDATRNSPAGAGQGDPDRPLRITELLGSGLSGTLNLRFAHDTAGVSLRVFPSMAVWRWRRLRTLWDAEDQPVDPYSPDAGESARPIVDPDLIGPDDFRCPIPKASTADPDAAFDIWLRRRTWLDGRLAALRVLGENLPTLLAALRPPTGAAPTDYPWRDAPSDLDGLATALVTGTVDEVRTAQETVGDKLQLAVDAFVRLMELRSAGPSSPAEWAEVRAILASAYKRDAHATWIAEETTATIRLDASTFVGASRAAEVGDWPPEPVPASEMLGGAQPPLVDPERVAVTALPTSVAGDEARRLFRRRIGELAANRTRVRAAAGAGWDSQLAAALGPAPTGTTWAAWIAARAAELDDLDPTVVAQAEQAGRSAGLTPGALRRLATLTARIGAGVALSTRERADAEQLLADARKVRVLYPAWRTEEGAAARPLPYWRVRRLALTRWRAGPDDRQIWLLALARRNRPPVVDPDLVAWAWIRTAGSTAAARRTQRAAQLFGREQALRQLLGATPDLAAVDATLVDAGWTSAEHARYAADLTARRLADSAAAVVGQVLGFDADRLADLRAAVQAGGNDRTAALRVVLGELGFSSEAGFVDLADVLAADPTTVTAQQWSAFDATLTRLALVGGLVRAARDAEDRGQRLADRVAAAGLDVTAWRRLLATRLIAVAGGPLLAAERDDLIAIAVRWGKERQFGAWRREEQATAAARRIRLGPDSFAIPADAEAAEPPPWRVKRAEWTGWLETLRARGDQHDQVGAALADAIVRVEEATLPILRDGLTSVLPVPTDGPDEAVRWAADHLLLDAEESGCRRTTRVGYAIDTVLALLWSVRTGQLTDTYPQLALAAYTFDEDWRWIGSYATWRSAMLVHLYPENLLRPSLRRYRSPALSDVLDQVRDGRRLTAQRARRIAAGYAEYFADVCRLDLARMVCAQAGLAYSPVMLVRGDGRPRQCEVYVAASEASRRVYWTLRDLSTVATGTGYEVAFWHRLTQFKPNEVTDLVGATVYQPGTDPARRRWLYVFAKTRTIDGPALVFLRYDLDTATWEGEPTPLEPPEGVKEFSAWLFPTRFWEPPKIGFEYVTVRADARQTTRMSRSLNGKGTGWEPNDFALLAGFGSWQNVGGGRVDLTAAGVVPRLVFTADVDGDGRDELVMVPKVAGPAMVMRFDGTNWTALPRPADPIPTDAFVTAGRFSATDPNDRRDDIVWIPPQVGSHPVVARFRPDTQQWTASPSSAGWSAPRVIRCVAAGDFDGDGRAELAVTPYDGSGLVWILGAGTGASAGAGGAGLVRRMDLTSVETGHDHRTAQDKTMGAAFRFSPTDAVPGIMVAGDFDGDGRDEAAAAIAPDTDNISRGNDWWSLDLRAGTRQWAPLGPVDPAWPLRTVADLDEGAMMLFGATVGDFDGDGRDEIAVIPSVGAPNTGTTVPVMDFRPGPSAADPAIRGSWGFLPGVDLTNQLTPVLAIVAGDFDGDGSDELALLGNGQIWLRKYDLQAGGWVEFTGGLTGATEPSGFAFGVAGNLVGGVGAARQPRRGARGRGAPDQLVLQPGTMTTRLYAIQFPQKDEQMVVDGVATTDKALARLFVRTSTGPARCHPPVPLTPLYQSPSGWLLDDQLRPAARRSVSTQALADNAGRSATVQRYVWEALYDLPVCIALALQDAQAYEAALDWFRLVYDYTVADALRKSFAGLVADAHGLPDQAEADPLDYARRLVDWVRDPLDPHAIAAVRPHTYTRGTLQLLVGCLLDYADAEFTRDTGESLARARILYETARELLRLPVVNQHYGGCADVAVRVPTTATHSLLLATAHGLERRLAGVADADHREAAVREIAAVLDAGGDDPHALAVRAERAALGALATIAPADRVGEALDRLPGLRRERHLALGDEAPLAAALAHVGMWTNGTPLWFARPTATDTFCVSPNPMCKALRLHAELNLFKIHTCRNIAGMRRQLEAYAAPTDQSSGLPMIGADGELVLPGTASPPPTPYRYSALAEQAKRLAVQAQELEGMLLSTLEKRDAEALNLLRARQDVRVARAEVRLQELRVHEAEDRVTLAQLQERRAAFEQQHYQELVDGGLNEFEREALDWLQWASGFQIAASIASLAGAGLHAVAVYYGKDPAEKLSSAAAAAAATASALGGLAANASTMSQWNSLRAGYARSLEDWRFRGALAGRDRQIAAQQVTIEKDGVRVSEQEREISELRVDFAEQILEFQQTKFTSVELFDWMAGVLERCYRWFLQQATATAQLAAQQLAFERQEGQPPAIRADYWQPPATGLAALDGADSGPDRRGITGAERLLRDIAALDQYAFETNRRKLQLSRTFSLAELDPLGFQRLRTDGVMTFLTPLRLYDRDFPGHYLRMIRRVAVSVVAFAPPNEGIRATLTAGGLSRVVVGPDVFKPVIVHRPPESVALTSALGDTGVFRFEPASGLRDPFEGLGVDTTWELRLPRAANPFDFASLADVLVTVDYTALDSFDLRAEVVRDLDQSTDGERGFSLRYEFADAWWDLHNPEQTATPLRVSFTTGRADFPPNLDELAIAQVAVSLVTATPPPAELSTVELRLLEGGSTASVGGTGAIVDGVVSTRRGNGGPLLPITGRRPVGRWELALPDGEEVRDWLAGGGLTDLLVVVGYRGRTPAWPT